MNKHFIHGLFEYTKLDASCPHYISGAISPVHAESYKLHECLLNSLFRLFVCTVELLCVYAVATSLEYLSTHDLLTAITVYKWPSILMAGKAKSKSCGKWGGGGKA